MPDARRKQIIADNTFLLTLDGDVDFQPSAVQLLVDRMKKNDKVGAACGRIHPVGTGGCCVGAGVVVGAGNGGNRNDKVDKVGAACGRIHPVGTGECCGGAGVVVVGGGGKKHGKVGAACGCINPVVTGGC